MLSVSSMALAAMLGSACGTNMANINDCNAALYNTGNCPQAVQYPEGRTGPEFHAVTDGSRHDAWKFPVRR